MGENTSGETSNEGSAKFERSSTVRKLRTTVEVPRFCSLGEIEKTLETTMDRSLAIFVVLCSATVVIPLERRGICP